MPSPGESLKQEREAAGKSLEEMAEATGIRLDFLTALEQDAFESIPGRGFGKLYIRAYAEVLGFDPKPVIDAYDQAMNARPVAPAPPLSPPPPRPVEAALARWREERMGEAESEEEDELPADPEPQADGSPEVPAEDELPPVEDEFESRWAKEGWGRREPPRQEPVTPASRAPAPYIEPRVPASPPPPPRVEPPIWPPLPEIPTSAPESQSGFRRWPAVAGLLLLVLLVVAGVNSFRSRREPAPSAEPLQPTQPEPAPAPAEEVPTDRFASPSPIAAPPPPPRQEPTESSHLTVSEFGVGERDRFESGQRVTFTTRVLGGRSGERIRHVWLRDGEVEQSIGLSLGGSSWRTHSNKTVGRPGAWAVEARDDEGRVLARSEFTVAP